MTLPRTLMIMLAACLLTAALPVPAGASTQELAGLLEDGRLVRFTRQAPTALTAPVRVRGLLPRERLVAITARPGVLVGLGSSAHLYRVDAVTGRAAPAAAGQVLDQGLRGGRFSLALSGDGARVRILSDVGQDVTVDLSTGAETPGPGLRTAQGSPLRPAATMGPGDLVVGVDLLRDLVVRETDRATGTATATTPQRPAPAPTAVEPSAFAVGASGAGYLVAAISDLGRVRQSALFDVDTQTPRLQYSGHVFLRRVVGVAALRLVPEDRAPMRAQIDVPRRISVRRLAGRGILPVSVRTSEAGQILISLRVRDRTGVRRVGFAVATRDTPGRTPFQRLHTSRSDRRVLRRSVGRRVKLVIRLDDFKRNSRTVVRHVRLGR